VPSLAARAPSIARNDAVYFDRTTTAIASDQSNAAVSQRFKSELAQDEKKAADKDTLKPAVLASFSFELTGTDVRVVDADGSVYSGTIEQQATAEADLLKEAAPSKAKSLDLAQETRRAESPPTGAVAAKPARDSATYSFHVTGTNRTLSAKVDFSGSFSAREYPVPRSSTKSGSSMWRRPPQDNRSFLTRCGTACLSRLLQRGLL
jgi:hypothetical protein